MNDHLDTPVSGNRAQRRAAGRGKKAAALGTGLVLAAGAATTAATLASTAPASANTPLVVDSLADDGTGFTLREAILQANSDAGQDTITFSVTGTITLSNHLPAIHDALQIQGPGASALTIDGADQWNMINFYDISSSAGVNEVSGVTLTHGHASDSSYNGNFYNDDASGGGIVVRYGSADLTIANAVITDNYAENDGGGVNLYDTNGNVTISNTEISNNRAYYGGGGLYADGDGSLNITITNSVITGNIAGDGSGEKYYGGNGGGLYVDNANLTITNSTINFNEAHQYDGDDGYGGGVFVANAPLTMSGSFIGNNVADADGGGIFGVASSATIDFSTITGNQATNANFGSGGGGGAKFRDAESESTLTIRNSTVSNNTAQYYGGGLYLTLYGATLIENSTISGNTGNQAGGVYGSPGGLTLNQVTVTNNTALDPGNGEAVGGIQATGIFPTGIQARSAARAAHSGGGHEGAHGNAATEAGKKDRAQGSGVRAQASVDELDLIGTIVSGNAGVNIGANNAALTVNSDHSLLGVNGVGITVNNLGGSLLGVDDPGLEPLANNGGTTATHALAVGSPAKDAGPNPLVPFTGSDFDQRGAGFARVADGTVDIGAFEVQAPEPIDIAPKFTG